MTFLMQLIQTGIDHEDIMAQVASLWGMIDADNLATYFFFIACGAGVALIARSMIKQAQAEADE